MYFCIMTSCRAFLSLAGAYSVVLFAGHLSYIILMITFLPNHVVSCRKINEHKFQITVTEIVGSIFQIL